MPISSTSDLTREVKVPGRSAPVRGPMLVPVPDESFARLHIAGWLLDEAAVAGPAGVTWVITGSSGARRIRAEGPTRTAARWAVVEQVADGGTI